MEIKRAQMWSGWIKPIDGPKERRKARAQWCDHACSTYCMWLEDDCHVQCQRYYPHEYCDWYCGQVGRDCLCSNNCCQGPCLPGEPDPCA